MFYDDSLFFCDFFRVCHFLRWHFCKQESYCAKFCGYKDGTRPPSFGPRSSWNPTPGRALKTERTKASSTFTRYGFPWDPYRVCIGLFIAGLGAVGTYYSCLRRLFVALLILCLRRFGLSLRDCHSLDKQKQRPRTMETEKLEWEA